MIARHQYRSCSVLWKLSSPQPFSLFAAPILAVIWLLIRLDSPGNPVFRQDRVARGGTLFRFSKFRTLYADARQRFPELYAYRYDSEQLATLGV